MGTTRKKAILVVSFGTSYPETRRKTIEAVERRIAKSYGEYEFRRAFTSKKVIEKIKKNEGVDIDTLDLALNKLSEEGFNEVLVQSLHIINGYEYHDVVRVCHSQMHKFDRLMVGSVLLNETEDYFKTVEAVMKSVPVLKEHEALVLMGHGTHHGANASYPALNFFFSQTGYERVFVGTVEGYPEVPEILNLLNQKKIKKVHLMPFMLVAGDHAVNDMAGDDGDSWKTVLEEAGYEVAVHLRGLGELEAIQDIFIEHIEKALSAEQIHH